MIASSSARALDSFNASNFSSSDKFGSAAISAALSAALSVTDEIESLYASVDESAAVLDPDPVPVDASVEAC